ncbi:MAG: hypothetical protein ACRD4E_07855 [Bryobacteraceae bacterium]
MGNRLFVAAIALAAFSATMTAQNQTRTMTIIGGGAPDRGKCTIDVVVDGAAEVEIRGNRATLRNLSGAAPQWRRFECTGPLPANPGNFRFTGVDGRGRQELIHDPRSGGSALVRIDDPDSGSEGYTFDITWGNAAPPPPFQSQDRGQGQGRPDNRGFDRPGDRARTEPGSGYNRDWDSFHGDRANAFQGDDWRMHLFARIREDLDHVQAVTFSEGGDQYRLTQARRELDHLEALQARGRYSRRELDDVVMALSRVVADNRLIARDRDVLNDDLRRLQDFRANTRDYGVR